MNRKKSGRKIWIAGGVAAIIAAAIGVRAYLGAQPPNLLEHARTLWIIPEWKNQKLAGYMTYHVWISPNEAAVWPRPDLSERTRTYRVGSDAPTPIVSNLPLTLGGSPETHWSPDWRYSATVPTMNWGGQPTDVRIDGRNDRLLTARLPIEAAPNAVWTPDSRSLLLFDLKKQMAYWRLTPADGSVTRISFPRDVADRIRGNDAAVLGFRSSDRLLVSLHGAMFAGRAIAPGSPDTELVEIALNAPIHVIALHWIRAPSAFAYGWLTLAPTGDRLLWAGFCAIPPQPWLSLAHLRMPIIRAETFTSERAWVSRTDGTGMHDLGCYRLKHGFDLRANPPPPSEPWIIDPKWMPDGKGVSFVYRDRLMMVPVADGRAGTY